MKIKDEHGNLGFSDKFNIHSYSEVIVGYEEGDMDSAFIKDLQVWIEKLQQWKPMSEAFRDKDIIPDNHNVWFAEPQTEEDRERGYFL